MGHFRVFGVNQIQHTGTQPQEGSWDFGLCGMKRHSYGYREA